MAEKLTSVHCKYCSKEMEIDSNKYREKGHSCIGCKITRVVWFIVFYFVYSIPLNFINNFFISEYTQRYSYSLDNALIIGLISGGLAIFMTWLAIVTSKKLTELRYYIQAEKAKQEVLTQIKQGTNSTSIGQSIEKKPQNTNTKTNPKKKIITYKAKPNGGTTIFAKYCKKCGGKIDDETRKCTSCGKQYFKIPNFTPKYCKQCGKPIDRNTQRCTNCNKRYDIPKKIVLGAVVIIISIVMLHTIVLSCTPVYVLSRQGSVYYHDKSCYAARYKISLLEAKAKGYKPCTCCD